MGDMLSGRKVAILATDGVEQIEMTHPRAALVEEGAEVHLVAPTAGGGRIQAWNHHDKGESFTVDEALADVNAFDYDALVLPGGVINPDSLRLKPEAVGFVRHFVESQKPVAAICHGPWTLVEADAVRGKRMTSWPSLATDIRNAGGEWVDEETVVDGNLVTARKPGDLDAFCAATVQTIRKAPSRESIRP
jgi:protease I